MLPGVAAAAAAAADMRLAPRLTPLGAATRARSSWCCCEAIDAVLLLRDSAESESADADAAATGARHGERAAATAAVATAPPLRAAFEPARADPVLRRGGVGRIVERGRGRDEEMKGPGLA